jgi:predicted nuclease with TOPRIM domain
VTERRYLMDGLAKLKTERDILDELVTTCEEENTRVAKMLAETRAELEELKSRRWWHLFLPVVKLFKQWAKAATA